MYFLLAMNQVLGMIKVFLGFYLENVIHFLFFISNSNFHFISEWLRENCNFSVRVGQNLLYSFLKKKIIQKIEIAVIESYTFHLMKYLLLRATIFNFYITKCSSYNSVKRKCSLLFIAMNFSDVKSKCSSYNGVRQKC